MYNTSQHLQTILDKHVILFFFSKLKKYNFENFY